jgi:hypothetical protein
MNELSHCGGMFRDELPQQFLHLMSTTGWKYIKHIYAKVISRYKNHKDKNFNTVFISCLRTVKSWCPRTKYEELAKLKKQYPYVSQIYESCYLEAMNEFCRSLHQKKFKQRRFTIPIFDDFFVLFLGKISDEEYVQNLTILQYTFDQLMFLFSNILRSAFMECIQFISIPPLEEAVQYNLRPYEQDVESVMSLSEANLKWHDHVQNLKEDDFKRDRADIAESVRSVQNTKIPSSPEYSDSHSNTSRRETQQITGRRERPAVFSERTTKPAVRYERTSTRRPDSPTRSDRTISRSRKPPQDIKEKTPNTMRDAFILGSPKLHDDNKPATSDLKIPELAGEV